MNFKIGKMTSEFLALTVGVLLGMSYVLLKSFDIGGGLGVFGVSALLGGTILGLVRPGETKTVLFSGQLIWRGVLFGATQILICEAIQQGSVFASLNASVFGSVVGSIFGWIILKEALEGYKLIALLISLVGAVICIPFQAYSLFGVFSGLLLGTNATLHRSIMKTGRIPTLAAAAIPLMYGGVVMIITSKMRNGVTGFYDYSLKQVVFAVTLVAIQLLTCQVLKQLDSQRTSILTLMRLPSAAFFEFLVFGSVVSNQQIVGMALIIIGAVVLIKLHSVRTLSAVQAKPIPRANVAGSIENAS
jgi:drug/metabolite transporter (DMT)-like permease